jgi:HSP20 family protein
MHARNHRGLARELGLNESFMDTLDLFRSGLPGLIQQERGDSLKVDVIESNEGYVIHADVPEIPRENIKVRFDKGVLSIEVDARAQKEIKEGSSIIRQERYFAKKSRSFTLRDSVDENAIKASCKDGVLTVELPKKPSATVVREITIE